jgi:hypothetical protein
MLGNWRCERNNAGWPRRWNDERGPPMTVHPKHILHTCYTLFNGWIHGKQTKFVCSPKFRSCIYTSILVSISQERPYIIFYDISSYLYYWRGYTNLRPNIYEAESLLHQYIIWDRTPLGTNETEDDTTLYRDKDRHTHDWVPTRWKSSFSLMELCWAPMRRMRYIHLSKWRSTHTWLSTNETKVIIFINTFCLHQTWRCRCNDDHYTQLNQRFSTDLLCRCN